MALKQLLLRSSLKRKKEELAALLEQKSVFDRRTAELEAALEEAETDEDFAAVEENTNALDAEINEADVESKATALEGEIAGIEGELRELDEKTSNAGQEASSGDPASQTEEREVITFMSKRTIWGGLSPDRRSAIMARDDTREFLERACRLSSENRSVTGADLLIPETLLALIRNDLNKYGKLASKVNVKVVRGTSRQPISGDIPEAVWTEMVASFNEMSISFSQIECDGYKVAGYIAVPNSTLTDGGEMLLSEILDNIAQSIGYALDKAILYGTGVKMPVGIVTRLAQTSKPSAWGANAPEWTDLHTTNIIAANIESLDDAKFFAALILKLGIAKSKRSNGEKFWCMNENTKMKILSKAVTFSASGSLVASVNNTMPIIGGEIVELDFLKDGDIVGGYGSLYLLVEREGASLRSSEHNRFIQDQTVFAGSARYDGQPVFGEAFVAINLGSASPAKTMDFAEDTANKPPEPPDEIET